MIVLQVLLLDKKEHFISTGSSSSLGLRYLIQIILMLNGSIIYYGNFIIKDISNFTTLFFSTTGRTFQLVIFFIYTDISFQEYNSFQ